MPWGATPLTRVRLPLLAPFLNHCWPSGTGAELQPLLGVFDSRAVVHTYGPLVLMEHDCLASSTVRVQVPQGPPNFRPAAGLQALASEAGCRWFESSQVDHKARRVATSRAGYESGAAR